MLKTWTSKYPILKLACPQGINQMKLSSHIEETSKLSTNEDHNLIYPRNNTLQSLYTNHHISLLALTSKPHNVFAIFVEHSHSKDKETLIFNNMQMLIKISKVC